MASHSVSGRPSRRVQLSRSHASYSTGWSGASSRATVRPGRSSSRSWSSERTETSAPVSSQATARWRLASERSVTMTASPGSIAAAATTPCAGTAATKASEPSRRRCTGPSPAGASGATTTSRAGRLRAEATASGPGARSASASAISASKRSAIRACSASASACTQAIDDPGRMSWNCWTSTSFHSWSSSAATAAVRSGGPPTPAHHSSASWSRRSQVRFPSFVRIWLVSVPRCISKYSSPRQVGTGAPAAASPSTEAKNPSTVPSSRRGRPSRSAMRRARPTISRVGPPPPSP